MSEQSTRKQIRGQQLHDFLEWCVVGLGFTMANHAVVLFSGFPELTSREIVLVFVSFMLGVAVHRQDQKK